MDEEFDIYNNALIEIENVSKEIENELNYQYDIQNVMDVPSTLDKLDYCYVFLFGMMGAILSTNKKLKKYLAEIHDVSNDQKGEYDQFQILMGKLLHHSGDLMDKRQTRSDFTKHFLHRLYWGHDILSISEDNPFYLMIKQKGILGGIFQTLRHLIADTMSKEGLPVPGSSWLDYEKENGRVSNYLINIIKDIPKGEGIKYTDIYSSLFTIKALDVAGGTFARLLAENYIRIRKIEDKLRKSQIVFMVYAINFYTEAVIGASRQKGVPYINIPVGSMMITSFLKFCYLNIKEDFQISNSTKELLAKSDELIEKYELQLKELNTFDSNDEMMENINQIDSNMNALIEYLGGDEN